MLSQAFPKRNSNLCDEHGELFLDTNPVYFGQLIGACSQIIEHDINYSLRYLEGQNLHSHAVKIDAVLHLYHRNSFQLNAKIQYNLNKNV